MHESPNSNIGSVAGTHQIGSILSACIRKYFFEKSLGIETGTVCSSLFRQIAPQIAFEHPCLWYQVYESDLRKSCPKYTHPKIGLTLITLSPAAIQFDGRFTPLSYRIHVDGAIRDRPFQDGVLERREESTLPKRTWLHVMVSCASFSISNIAYHPSGMGTSVMRLRAQTSASSKVFGSSPALSEPVTPKQSCTCENN